MAAILWSGGLAAHADDLKIGLLLPPEEAEAISLRRGVQLGVEHVNQSAGAKASLLLRSRAGQWGTDGEEAGSLVLDDSVSGLIAPPGGASSHLALQVAGRTATPVISLCPDSSVVGAGIPWMVRIVPSTRDEGRILLSAFRTNAAGHPFRWCALVPTERAGREVSADLAKAVEATNCQLDRVIAVPPDPADFSEIEKQVRTAQPNGVLLWLNPALAGRLAKSLRTAGFKGQFAGPSRLRSRAFSSNAGAAAEDCVVPGAMLDSASQSISAEFCDLYRQHYGEEPDTTARTAYDAAVLLAEVLRQSGENPPHTAFPIVTERPGVSGNLKFDRDGNRLLTLELLRFHDGRFIPHGGRCFAGTRP